MNVVWNIELAGFRGYRTKHMNCPRDQTQANVRMDQHRLRLPVSLDAIRAQWLVLLYSRIHEFSDPRSEPFYPVNIPKKCHSCYFEKKKQ